jgi:hypothetical protein
VTPESIIAIVSVSVTGLVSILGILLPAYLEYRKSEQEKIAAKIERIHEKAENLSLSLAKFRNPAYLDAMDKSEEERIKLRANHDAWEIVIFSELEEHERNRVREMRGKMYGFGYLTGKDENGESSIMKLIDTVVEFSCSATERLNNSRSNCRLWSIISEMFGLAK